MIVIQSQEDWEKEMADAKEQGKTVVVDFFAEWCPPCRIITPVFEELSVEMDDLVFLKVDVDGVPQIASENGISAMPTFMVFKDGKKVNELVGAAKDRLKAMV